MPLQFTVDKDDSHTDESVGKIIKPRPIYDVQSSEEEGIYFKKSNVSIFFFYIDTLNIFKTLNYLF